MTIAPRPAGPILVVEGDRRLGCAIAEQLMADGFGVELAHTVEHARVLARERSPALALLGGVAGPGGTIRLLEEIRHAEAGEFGWNPRLPAIVLAARHRELDLLRAFDAGADDFLARTAGYLELRARLAATLRRADPADGSQTRLEAGVLVVDLRTRVAQLDGRALVLRRMEFELLAHLAREPDRVFSREELLRAVWGYRGSCSSRTLDSHASRLRRKLTDPGSPAWIINLRGIGYRLR